MPIDYKKYPPNWKTEIVPRILERAKDKCEICLLENKLMVWSGKLWVRSEGGRYKLATLWFADMRDVNRMEYFGKIQDVKIVKVVLTIAHLDHDETNHHVQDDRLKAMCQYCHLNYDAKEKYTVPVTISTPKSIAASGCGTKCCSAARRRPFPAGGSSARSTPPWKRSSGSEKSAGKRCWH